MELVEAVGAGPVGLDTAIFIYFIEEHPRYLRALQALFVRLDAGELRAVTSAVTLSEVLVVPYRARDFALAERYESLLTRSRGLVFRDLEPPLLRAAAQLRASTMFPQIHRSSSPLLFSRPVADSGHRTPIH